jgi:hypothetical protein
LEIAIDLMSEFVDHINPLTIEMTRIMWRYPEKEAWGILSFIVTVTPNCFQSSLRSGISCVWPLAKASKRPTYTMNREFPLAVGAEILE